jgi:hypothetical protein
MMQETACRNYLAAAFSKVGRSHCLNVLTCSYREAFTKDWHCSSKAAEEGHSVVGDSEKMNSLRCLYALTILVLTSKELRNHRTYFPSNVPLHFFFWYFPCTHTIQHNLALVDQGGCRIKERDPSQEVLVS